MKTSNKLLIGAFGVLVIFTIAFLITGKSVLNRSMNQRNAAAPTAVVREIG